MTWEISRMGRRYLQLEDDAGPVFELKWQPIRGVFSHERHLRKVASRHWSRRGARVQACDLPQGWAAALEAYSARAFQWQGSSLEGRGAILFCSHCQTAHLLQFLRRDIVDQSGLCCRVLTSLRDHPPCGATDHVRWAIYDLRADLPSFLRLENYRFGAGAFCMTFDGPRRTSVSLHRWGPASVLLKQQTLRRFVARQLAWTADLMSGGMIEDETYLHLEGAYPVNPWARRIRQLLRQNVYHWLHAWHDEIHNRILAVDAHGSTPLPRRVLEQVSDRYVVV